MWWSTTLSLAIVGTLVWSTNPPPSTLPTFPFPFLSSRRTRLPRPGQRHGTKLHLDRLAHLRQQRQRRDRACPQEIHCTKPQKPQSYHQRPQHHQRQQRQQWQQRQPQRRPVFGKQRRLQQQARRGKHRAHTIGPGIVGGTAKLIIGTPPSHVLIFLDFSLLSLPHRARPPSFKLWNRPCACKEWKPWPPATN